MTEVIDTVKFEKTSVAEKYRPKRFDDFVGLEQQIKELKNFVNSQRLANIFFVGKEGAGKTALAKALITELQLKYPQANIDYVVFNASDNRGIDFIRNEIKTLATAKRMTIPILDEADQLTSDAQHAMRYTCDELLANGKFVIMTGNTLNKTIRPIKSQFKIMKIPSLTDTQIGTRIGHILKEENIVLMTTEEKQFVAEVIKNSMGDLRKAINEVFWYLSDDENIIDPSYFTYKNTVNEFNALMDKVVKGGDFMTLRDDIIALLYVNDPPISAERVITLTEQWLVNALKEGTIKSQDYVLGMQQVKMCDYHLTQGTTESIQIIGMLTGLNRVLSMGMVR